MVPFSIETPFSVGFSANLPADNSIYIHSSYIVILTINLVIVDT